MDIKQKIETNEKTLWYEFNALIPHLTEKEINEIQQETELLKKQIGE